MKRYLYILCVIGMIFILTGCRGSSDAIQLIYSNYNDYFYAYDTLELGFSYNESVSNPDSTSVIKIDATISLDDRVITHVPLFYFQNYERKLIGDVEYLTEINTPDWRLRYTPITAGIYEIKIFIHDFENKRQIHSETYIFNVLAGNGRGFLKVADDHQHLVFDNEVAYFGIGHNLCGWEWAGNDNLSGTFEYDAWFASLHQSGANMAQFDLSEGDNIEWTNGEEDLPYDDAYQGVNDYNDMMAWKMDYKVDKAQDYGLYFRLTLFHWEDFDREGSLFPDWGWDRNPYNSDNGGPVDDVVSFFSDEQAKTYVKDYLRYAVARWGYSPNLMVWELWNEVDAPDIDWGDNESYMSAESDITSWHQEMSEYMKAMDPYHMVTTSFASSSNGYNIFSLSSIDITTFHRYTMYNNSQEGGIYNTTESLYRIITQRLLQYGKPVIAGEFALSPGGEIQRESDPDGIAFHNQLWSSFMSGSFATAMHWTWGSYIDRYDLYDHYQPLSYFVWGEDFSGLETFSNIQNTHDAITYIGMKTDDRGYLWIKDTKNDYANVVLNGYEPESINNVNVTIEHVKQQDYVIMYVDTYTGQIIETINTSVMDSVLTLDIPTFTKDIAVKYLPADAYYQSANLGAGGVLNQTYQSGNAISLYASGADIGALSDDARFAYLNVTGDFKYTIQISSLTYGGSYSKAGIMIRNTLSASGKMMFFGMNGLGHYSWIIRDGLIADSSEWHALIVGGYMRIERKNNQLILSVSYDGQTFDVVETIENFLNEDVLLGVAASSKNTLGYNQAIFESISLIK